MPLRTGGGHLCPRETPRRTHGILPYAVLQCRHQARRLIKDTCPGCAEIAQKTGLPIVVCGTQRHDGGRSDIFDRALGQRIVLAHGVDLRIEELHADG